MKRFNILSDSKIAALDNTPAAVRSRLLALYPQAKLHLFQGSGHPTAVSNREEYLRVMLAILREP